MSKEKGLYDPVLAKAIWKDHYPKKIKFLLWEMNHKAINTCDLLQLRLPYLVPSPHWCAPSVNLMPNPQVTSFKLVPLPGIYGEEFYPPSIGLWLLLLLKQSSF